MVLCEVLWRIWSYSRWQYVGKKYKCDLKNTGGELIKIRGLTFLKDGQTCNTPISATLI